MRILIVKTSSLGDLIHTFPALTDAAKALPEAQFDWLVDQSFAEVPNWHPAVHQVHAIGLRGWHRRGLQHFWREWHAFSSGLRQMEYDQVIDAQGLLKSAVLAKQAKSLLVGYDRKSIREPLASGFYAKKYPIDRGWHAIKRLRHLFAQALGYVLDEQSLNYGLRLHTTQTSDQVILLHGTSWPSKLWPELYWAELADLIQQAGLNPCFAWHTPDERLRAERIIQMAGTGELLPAMRLTEMAQCLTQAAGVVGLDSGLSHLAAAVGAPAVTLYGATSTALTGAMGSYQRNMSSQFACAPCMRRECAYQGETTVRPACFAELGPQLVWQTLEEQMALQTRLTQPTKFCLARCQAAKPPQKIISV